MRKRYPCSVRMSMPWSLSGMVSNWPLRTVVYSYGGPALDPAGAGVFAAVKETAAVVGAGAAWAPTAVPTLTAVIAAARRTALAGRAVMLNIRFLRVRRSLRSERREYL